MSDSGKQEFKLQAQKEISDYSKAFKIFSDLVKAKPLNAEFRYFLGYIIDRMNADDGKQMFQLKKEMTIKASEQFEEVNRLEPIYKGEIIVLDPYSKITSIWGSLAEAYLNKKMIDSAKWAFIEGKKRGGFIDPILDFNRQLLNSCEKNSLLITYGDNITIPIWYLQTIDNFRNDILVVDANLINTIWYPKYLKEERNLHLSFSDSQIDTIEYTEWQPTKIEITKKEDSLKKLSWELRPTYMDKYILKGDRILLDIFKQNYFNKTIYFSANSDSSYNLFLSQFLIDEGLVNRVSNKQLDYQKDTVETSKNLKYYNIENIKAEDIKKSRETIILLNGFRWAYYSNAYDLLLQGNYDIAKQLMKEMTEKFNIEKLPFASEKQEKTFMQLFSQVNKN